MNRKELVKRIASVMRDNDIKKPVSSSKQVFHISDDEGNTKDFVVKKTNKTVLFTVNDIDSILDACLHVMEDALKHGESITVRGFGTLGLHYRKARTTKHPDTGELVNVDAHYIPKFTSGNNLKLCAKMFELHAKDNAYGQESQFVDENEQVGD